MERMTAGSATSGRGPARRWSWRLAAALGLVLLCALPAGATDAVRAGEAHTPVGPAPYVSDYGGNRVLTLSAYSGEQVTAPLDGLVRPTGMAWDAAGRLYATATSTLLVMDR